MTSTPEAICNLALHRIGQPSINSLSAPVKPHERELTYVYPQARDAELRKRRWRFAITRGELSADNTFTGNGDYRYRYRVPGDMLRVLRWDDEFSKEGVYLYSNIAGTLKVKYIKRVLEVPDYDPLFIDVLVCRIALMMVDRSTQSNTKKAALKDDYKDAMEAAGKANAFETGPEYAPVSSWIEARY